MVPLLHRYYEALRLPDSLFRRTSFPSLGDTLERLSFVPVRLQTQSRRIIPEFAVPVAPDPVDFRELSGSLKFPGNPHDHSPCSSTPAGPGTRYGTRGQRTRHGPRVEPKRGLLTSSKFRGSITRLLVSLSTPRGDGLPSLHVRLASGCWSQLCRAGFQPAGFLRKVSEHLYSSSSPELSWRKVRFA